MTFLPLWTELGVGIVAGVAGFVDSVSGGGGLLTLPTLLVAGVPPQMALGTSKFSNTFGTGVAVFNFAKKKKINWALVAHGLLFMLAGSLIGSRCVLFLPQSWVGKIIICLLPFGVVSLFFNRNQDHPVYPLTWQDKWLSVPLLCLGLGIYDGFFGPGVGSFLILGLFICCKRSMLESTANAKVFNVTSNFGALLMFIWHQKIIFSLACIMAVFNIVGNYLGSHMAMKKGAGFIRTCLIASFLLLLLVLMIRFL